MLVLGLETSCDETGVALYDSERGLLADALFSQIDLHRVFGGVVPELASRDHVKRMLPLIRQVLDEAGCVATEIDAIAYTAGPGLVGALLVGASCAQALAFAWDNPEVIEADIAREQHMLGGDPAVPGGAKSTRQMELPFRGTR